MQNLFDWCWNTRVCLGVLGQVLPVICFSPIITVDLIICCVGALSFIVGRITAGSTIHACTRKLVKSMFE